MKEIQECIYVLNRFRAAHYYVCIHTGNTLRISTLDYNIFTWTNALQSFQVAERRNPHWTSAHLAWVIAIMQNITVGLHAARIELLAEWLCNSQQQIHQPRRRQQLELSLEGMDTEVEQLPRTIIPSLIRAMAFARMREDSLPVMSSGLPATGAPVNLTDNSQSAAGPVRPTGKKYTRQPPVRGGAYNVTTSYIQRLGEFYDLHKQVRSQCQSTIDTISPHNIKQIAAKSDPGPAMVACRSQLASLLPKIKQEVDNARTVRITVYRHRATDLVKNTNDLLRENIQALRMMAFTRRSSTPDLGPAVTELFTRLSTLSRCYEGLLNAKSRRKQPPASSATH